MNPSPPRKVTPTQIAEHLRDTAPAPASVEPYQFTTAFPPEHFVSRFIDYASRRTDAAHEYHEAAALVLLAGVTPNVRAPLAQYADGLPTNLYVLFIGDSTKSRKSTVEEFGIELQRRVTAESLLADQASPEAFVEQLAARSGDSATWWVDEMGETIEKLHHAKYMAGLRGLLLKVYMGGSHRYQRTSKLTKAGTRIADALLIERSHLSILGCTTPAVFDILTGRDVESGFLGRFSIIMPTRKPPRRPFFALGEALGADRNALTKRLHDLYVWAKSAERSVCFATGTLEHLDTFAASLEEAAETANDRAKAMLQRLSAMAIKVAMLAAAGSPQTLAQDDLLVTLPHAESALAVCRPWAADALAFASRIGENEFEKNVARCLRAFQQLARKKGAKLPRREIAKNAHLSKRTLDDVQATLADRGHIRVETDERQSGPDAVLWGLR